MSYDICGNYLRPGYCEVHPNHRGSYPCDLCEEQRMEDDYYRQQEEDYCKELENQYQTEMYTEYLLDLEVEERLEVGL